MKSSAVAKNRKRTPEEHQALKLKSFQQRLETGALPLGNRHSQLKDHLVGLCQELQERLRRWRDVCTCERICMKWLDWLRDALAPLMRTLPKGERYRTQLVFNAAGYLRAQLEQRQLALP
ncbi:MAG: hypothetical protein INF43_03940 [Alphaproteobacteria bacterium]|jgi:hypothetical protein|nr:hypothetical protein [Alphaproteobacteria bacterium]